MPLDPKIAILPYWAAGAVRDLWPGSWSDAGARRAILASGPCCIPRAGFTRALFAFHRPTPLAPAIPVLTGADNGDRITRRDPHKVKIQRVSVAEPTVTVWLFDTKNLPAVGGWSFVHTNLHSAGAQFAFLDGHARRFRNMEYWSFTTNHARLDNPQLRWIP